MGKMMPARPGNRALDYVLRSSSPTDVKVRRVVDMLPLIADQLCKEASASAAMLRQEFEVSNSDDSSEAPLLPRCVFDLQLTTCFAEFHSLTGDPRIASALVDALLYQATGTEPSDPTMEEFLAVGTQNTRGIGKYQTFRKEKPHIRDAEAWLFGKECSAMLLGSALDFSGIVSVSVFSLEIRARASWLLRLLLTGQPPSEADRQELRARISERDAEVRRMIEDAASLARTNQKK
jgi:hypothetical protein